VDAEEFGDELTGTTSPEKERRSREFGAKDFIKNSNYNYQRFQVMLLCP